MKNDSSYPNENSSLFIDATGGYSSVALCVSNLIRLESPVASSQRVIAIGDIHGCSHALDAVLTAIDVRPSDLIVCLGDFIDQGRETQEVIDKLIELSHRCKLVTLAGNHEEMLLEALDDPKLCDSWMMVGGIPTVNSYRFGGTIKDIRADHIDFIRNCVDFFQTETHIFVHANYLSYLKPEEWPIHVMRWSLLEEPYPEAHESGKTVIVGHTEQRDGEILDLDYVKCIDTACCNYGWLTAFDVYSGEVWQASKWGLLRESPAETKPGRLPPLPVEF